MPSQVKNWVLVAAAAMFSILLLVASVGVGIFGFGLLLFGQVMGLVLIGAGIVGLAFTTFFVVRVVMPSIRLARGHPYRQTTEAEAREALVQCGISPDAVAWRIGPDGSFVIGRNPDDEVLTFEQVECLMAWIRRERIRAFLMGETHER